MLAPKDVFDPTKVAHSEEIIIALRIIIIAGHVLGNKFSSATNIASVCCLDPDIRNVPFKYNCG